MIYLLHYKGLSMGDHVMAISYTILMMTFPKFGYFTSVTRMSVYWHTSSQVVKDTFCYNLQGKSLKGMGILRCASRKRAYRCICTKEEGRKLPFILLHPSLFLPYAFPSIPANTHHAGYFPTNRSTSQYVLIPFEQSKQLWVFYWLHCRSDPWQSKVLV